MCQAKGISNRLYLKEQFHIRQRDEGAKISYQLSVFNDIISKLESDRVKIEDQDKASRIILSLPPSYDQHMKTIYMYKTETLNFAKVFDTLVSEERN